MPMMKRWTCPTCNDGKLAPSRPRRDDARTYCLTCSEKSGRLVRRVCGALEKARSSKEEAAKAAAAKRAAAAKLNRTQEKQVSAARRSQASLVEAVDLAPFVVPAWRAARASTQAREGCPLAAPEVEWSDRRGHGKLGHATRDGRRIRIYPRRARSVAGALGTLIHEMAHAADVLYTQTRASWHGPRFQAILADAGRALLPGWEPPPRALWATWRVVDDALEIEIARRIAAGLPPVVVS